jgi:hypothetical protein
MKVKRYLTVLNRAGSVKLKTAFGHFDRKKEAAYSDSLY